MVSLEQLNREIKVANQRIAEYTPMLTSHSPAERVAARKLINYYMTQWTVANRERTAHYSK